MIKTINFRRLTAAASVLAAALMIIGFNFYADVSSAQTDVEKAVADVLKREAAAIEKGDLQALDKIWSNDASVLVFENGGVNEGWENYRNKHLAPELKSFKDLKFVVSDIAVKADKKIAWATYKYTLAADFNKQKIETGGVGTMIFEKKDGKWLIVHSHTSSGY